jgi:hypothetical protein
MIMKNTTYPPIAEEFYYQLTEDLSNKYFFCELLGDSGGRDRNSNRVQT